MAGSNALTRGVPRRLMQGDGPVVPVIGAGQIPTIQYSSGNARALQQFSQNLFQIGDQYQDQLDKAAEAEALTKGAVAGATGDFELQDYGTIRGRSFNKAAIETFAATLDTQAIVKVNELQNKYWNNPEKLQSELQAYGDGVAAQLGQRSPEQAEAFKNRFTVRSIPAVESVKDMAYKLTRSEADAKLVESESALRAEIKSHSSDLFSENPDRSRAAMNAIGMVQGDFMKIYQAVDPSTGKPLYSPEEVAKAKKAFGDTVMTEASLSWFDQQPDKAGAYMKFINGDFKMKVASSNDQVPIVMANRNATRNDPLLPDVANKMKAAAAATGISGVSVVVMSGGQETADEIRRGGGGTRTGSKRHDHGGAGDVRLAVNGKVLDMATNREAYVKFAENAAAAGLTGIGVDEAKGYLHLGGGTPAAWGYRGQRNGREFLPADFGAAIERGRGQKLDYEPKATEVALSDTLSPTALNSLDAEMRSRISFVNTQMERQQTQERKAVEEAQARNSFEFTSRVYAAGAKDPSTGKEIRPLTREEIVEASRNGMLKPNDAEAIMKALTTDRPETSDDATLRDLQRRVYAGEDIYRAVVDAGSQLSSKDSGTLLGLNQSVVRNNLGELNQDQKYYFNTLNDRLGQTGIFDKFDQGKANRKAQALDEYRRRIMDPDNTESPSEISDDIATRATGDAVQMDQSRLGKMIPPRFAIPRADAANRLDVVASGKNLVAAHAAKRITDAQFKVEQEKLVNWAKLQAQVDAQEAAKPKGKK